MDDLKPFGYENDDQEILVWHTRTERHQIIGYESYGYKIEQIKQI